MSTFQFCASYHGVNSAEVDSFVLCCGMSNLAVWFLIVINWGI